MDIIGKRKIWFTISLVVLALGIVSMLFRWVNQGSPLNLGIDFTGGTIINIEFSKEVNETKIRTALKEIDLEKSIIQLSGNRQAIIRTAPLDDIKQEKILEVFKSKVASYDSNKLEINKVGPVIGKELTTKAVMALLIAFVCMIIYISFRFEFKFGVAAILALVHDVFVVLGIF
jgi:preprotein translocase subunit SecF